MKRRHAPSLSALVRVVAACAGVLCAGAGAADPAHAYRFAPMNQYGLDTTTRYWGPIVDYVSRHSGVNLELKVGRTSIDTSAYVLTGQVDFAYSNHFHSPDRDYLGWKIFARRQIPPVRAEIVVLDDSPLRDLSALAGRRIVFPGPESVVPYKLPYAELLRRKITVQAVFAGNMADVFEHLGAGDVDAGGTNSLEADNWYGRGGRRLRVLWQSEPVFDAPLLVSERVPPADLAAVRKALLDMSGDAEGVKILEQASALIGLSETAGFVAAGSADYKPYRDFYRTAPAGLR